MTSKIKLSTPPNVGLITRNIKLVRKEINTILNSKSKIVYIVNHKKS